MRPKSKMPTTLTLLCFAWLIVIAGFATGIYVIFTNQARNPRAFIVSLAIILGSLFLSALARMIGNVGQILFDIKSLLYNNQEIFGVNDVLGSQLVLINETKSALKTHSENILGELKALSGLIKSQSTLLSDTKEILKAQSESVLNEFRDLFGLIKQTGEDAKGIKDLNQNICQIRNFFEQIERHLDLKK